MESSSSFSDRTTHNRSREFFICFTSMKSSSKSSILSPGRARDPSISLSTSLSRKLKASESIKNGQGSPMFPTGSKKRGSGFENPEPSSPKVTCIGQVRVKTKKQGKKMRNLSRRRSGEVSFRKIEHNQVQRQSSVNSIHHQQECSSHRNQRWVHLPLTICETLRGFGSEFSCLFPCKSSCFLGERVGRQSRDDLEKWLSGEGGKRRDVELVVDDEEDEEDDGRVIRRHVFNEIEIKDCDEGGRVSICIPPKNALLLMRCRSDPVKMEALANKFWEPKLQPAEDEDEDGGACNDENTDRNIEEEHVVVNSDKVKIMEVLEDRRVSISYNNKNEVEEYVADMKMGMEVQGNIEEEKLVEDLPLNEEMHEESEQEELVDEIQIHGEVQVEQEEKKVLGEVQEEDESSFVTALEALASQESEVVVEEERRVSYSCNSFLVDSRDGVGVAQGERSRRASNANDQEDLAKEAALKFDRNDSNAFAKKEIEENNLQVEENAKVSERENDLKIERETTPVLPDCLLLMMCEPKLSMEVSKETWVCSTDFIRCRPQKKKPHAPPHQCKKSAARDEEPVIKKRNSVDSKCSNPFAALPPPYPVAQNIMPGRSSCSLPVTNGGVSMAMMIEQKLGDAVAYEPFVLTRCKSEPMKTASKLTRRATFGVGSAGVGC